MCCLLSVMMQAYASSRYKVLRLLLCQEIKKSENATVKPRDNIYSKRLVDPHNLETYPQALNLQRSYGLHCFG